MELINRMIALPLTGLAFSLGACSMQEAGDLGNRSDRGDDTREVKTVQFEGSDVEVSWDRTAKTETTLTYSTSLTIWSNDAARLIEEATGCQASSGILSYPEGELDGMAAVSMPINCG